MAAPNPPNPQQAGAPPPPDAWAGDKQTCSEFLQRFVARDGRRRYHKYMALMQSVANRETTVFPIELDDVKEAVDETFALKVQQNALRYVQLFSESIDSLMPPPTVEFTDENTTAEDMIMDHRRQQADMAGVELMPAMTRRYQIILRPLTSEKVLSVRELRADHIGSLVQMRAIVTRATDVKPHIIFATYTCMQCQNEMVQEVKAASFMPLSTCEGEECKKNKVGAKLVLQTRGSKFEPFQELRVQELANQVPVGNTPRAMNVHARGSATRQANPGDEVVITGIYLPAVRTGFQALRTGLLASMFLDAYEIKLQKKVKSVEADAEHSEQVMEINQDAEWYEKLSSSIAPEIFGNDDVKKALLLLLVGGVGQTLSDKMKIRGDINVCLMGDPGVAKSQLLRYICTVSPRGIFTTGKGSSGVGLTASIQRDPLTDELVLEGGALVLADEGVCAIDEFDKMDENDRTAIYEVMEQQTISIAKAGITTTLNARSSILAAANPQYGRYNENKSVLENINLPSALLSRFDLLFLLLDRPDWKRDVELAMHVAYVHQNSTHPTLDFEPISPALMRAYVAQAKQFNPRIPTELTDYIVQLYVDLRQEGEEGNCMKSTPRTLLAILRLSTALARLRFSEEVNMDDVNEAKRLLLRSKETMDTTGTKKRRRNYTTEIYEMLMAQRTKNEFIRLDKARKYVLQSNDFTRAQFDEVVDYYASINIWQKDDAGEVLRVIEVPDMDKDDE